MKKKKNLNPSIVQLILFLAIATISCDDKEYTSDNSEENQDTATTVENDTTLFPSSNETDPTLPDADAQTLFDYDHVPTFDITLPEAQWDALLANAMDEEYTEAEVSFEGQPIGLVGLRFKGSYGTLYNCFDDTGKQICPRLSLKIKFDKYDKEQRFFGLKRLNFNTNRYDDSRMNERLVYDLYRSMGIVAPKAAWAVIRVNGKSFGLYGMVEELDGRFTDNRWPQNPDANLYKEVWPTDDSYSFVVNGLKTNKKEAEVSGFLEFSQAINAAVDDNEVLSVLEEYTDVDYWARYIAVDDAVLSYDGISYFYTDDGTVTHNHNYYFYEHSPSRFTLIPWDVEASFWINPDHAAPHWTQIPEDCSLTYPYWGGLAGAPGCDAIHRALNTDLSKWRAAVRELLDGPFALETMIENIDRHAAFMGDEARAPETPIMNVTFDEAVQNKKSIIPQLRAQLEQRIAQ